MREEFESAFAEEMVSRCGEGFRSSVRMLFVEKEPDSTYSNPIAHAGWWAWQASCDALRKDAERYRAIRDCDEIFIRYTDGNDIHFVREPEQLDALADIVIGEGGSNEA